MIPLTILERESASSPLITRKIAVNPFTVARMEEDDYDGQLVCKVWCDGMDKPYRVPSGISVLVQLVNDAQSQEVSE